MGTKLYFSFWGIVFLVLVGVSAYTFWPIRNISEEDVVVMEGVVSEVDSDGKGNIQIVLDGDPHEYYIYKGVAKSIGLVDLQQNIRNKRILLYTLHRWTPFTRDGIHPHVARIEVEGKIIYDEIRNDE